MNESNAARRLGRLQGEVICSRIHLESIIETWGHLIDGFPKKQLLDVAERLDKAERDARNPA